MAQLCPYVFGHALRWSCTPRSNADLDSLLAELESVRRQTQTSPGGAYRWPVESVSVHEYTRLNSSACDAAFGGTTGVAHSAEPGVLVQPASLRSDASDQVLLPVGGGPGSRRWSDQQSLSVPISAWRRPGGWDNRCVGTRDTHTSTWPSSPRPNTRARLISARHTHEY